MIYTLIVDNQSIDRNDYEPFVLQFHTIHKTGAEAENAARVAVNKFLKTAKGQKALRLTCGCFNWGDVACHVPDQFFIEQGLFPIPMNEEMSTVVMRDEDLTGANDEFTVEANISASLNLDDVAMIIENATFCGLQIFTFGLKAPDGVSNGDFIYNTLRDREAIELYNTEDNSVTYQLTVPKFLEGFKRWMEDGNCSIESADPIDPFAIAPEQADSILRYALLEKEGE